MVIKHGIFILLILTVLLPSVALTAVIKIPDDYTAIQAAVDAASDGDTLSIDPGTYSGTGNENILITGKSLYIVGDAGASTTILDLGGFSNGFKVEYNFETPLDSVVFKGLTLRNGETGVFINPVLYQSFGAVKIYDCRFEDNATAVKKDEFAGKKIFEKDRRASAYDSLFISNCIFADNMNGVILHGNPDHGAWGRIDSSTFTGHDQAVLAVTSFSTVLSIHGSVFDGNNTALKGPFSGYDLEIRNNGVGVYGRCDFIDIYDEIYLEGCTIEGNIDTVFHAGINIAVLNSDIINNSGELFAGTFSNTEAFSIFDFDNCLISNNGPVNPLRGYLYFDSTSYTYNDGLAFDHFYGEGRFRNSLLAKNTSDCIRIVYNGQIARDIPSSPIEISNTTIVYNNGSGLIYDSIPSGDIEITNSIIANNGGFGILIDTTYSHPNLNLACNDFYGNSMGNYEGLEDQTGLNNNISSEPVFCDVAGDNYGLDICSPCTPDNSLCGELIGAFDLSCSGTVHCGSVWHVAIGGDDINGNGSESNPFATIQKGIDSANEGDTVLIGIGTFTGDGNRDLNPMGKGVLITSSGGPSATIIDGQASIADPHRGFIFNSGEDSMTIIRGLTIKNCVVEEDSLGGAIWGFGSPPVSVIIEKNLIVDCGAGQGGAMMFQDGAKARIVNNTIVGNYAHTTLDGGICADSGIVINNVIRGNTPENFSGTPLVLTYNNIENGPAGNGNIDSDPLFADEMNGDFSLQESSPCINAGDPDPIYNDPDGTRSDIGAFYRHQYYPPEIESIGPQSTFENQLLEFAVTASDQNGTTPSLFASELPAGAIFEDNMDGTGLFSWTPEFSQIGVFPVTFYAADETDTVFEEIDITVNPLPPTLVGLYIEGIESNMNVIDHIPVLHWVFHDEGSRPQAGFEIAIGTDDDWTTAEMWEPGPFVSSDTFITYDGMPLSDGASYYIRLRADNGLAWSEWYESIFRMNSAPSVPSTIGPANDTIIMDAQPYLYGNIAIDPESDNLWYDFLYVNDGIFGPADTGMVVAMETVDDTVRTQIPVVLEDNWYYHWAIRAFDGYEYSDWSETASFYVNSDNQPPASFEVINPVDSSGIPLYDLLPTLQWTISIEPDPGDTVYYTLFMATDENFNFVNEIDSIYETEFTLSDSLAFGMEYWWKVRATDSYGMTTFSDNTRYFRTWRLGDVNTDWISNVVDIIYLVDYKFKSGPEPLPPFSGDVTGDCLINIIDIIHLIDYKFKEGPEPLPGCVPEPSSFAQPSP